MGFGKEEKKKEFKLRIYRYILRLIKFLSKLPNTPEIIEIKRQLIKSGTSVGANYFEAEAASSKKDYQNFFHYSLKSSNESKFWLALLRDSELASNDLIEEISYLLQETKEIANIFASSLITMKSKTK